MGAPTVPTRYPKGVTNVSPTDPYAFFGAPDPTKYHQFFDDFDDYDASRWDISLTEAGSGSAAIAAQFADGGFLRLLNDDADGDRIAMEFSGEEFSGGMETWLVEAGKPMFMKCRLQISDATDSAVHFGLHIGDTTPLSTTDAFYFRKADTDTTMKFVSVKDSAEATVDVGTVTNGAIDEWAMFYDGIGKVHVFHNGVKTGILEPGTSLPDNELLAVGMGVQNGAAAAKSINVDYLHIAKQRRLY